MKDDIKLQNFILEKYQFGNVEHKSQVIKLGNDPLVRKYIGDLDLVLDKIINDKGLRNKVDAFYVINYGREDYHYPIGITFVNKYERGEEENIYLSYALLEEYRKQNLGSMFLEQFAEKLLELYPNHNKIYGSINQTNIASKKTAELAGFKKDQGATLYSFERR